MFSLDLLFWPLIFFHIYCSNRPSSDFIILCRLNSRCVTRNPSHVLCTSLSDVIPERGFKGWSCHHCWILWLMVGVVVGGLLILLCILEMQRKSYETKKTHDLNLRFRIVSCMNFTKLMCHNRLTMRLPVKSLQPPKKIPRWHRSQGFFSHFGLNFCISSAMKPRICNIDMGLEGLQSHSRLEVTCCFKMFASQLVGGFLPPSRKICSSQIGSFTQLKIKKKLKPPSQ